MAARLSEEDNVHTALVRKRRVTLLGAANRPDQPHELQSHRSTASLCNMSHVKNARRVHPRAKAAVAHDEAAAVAFGGRFEDELMNRRAPRCERAVLPREGLERVAGGW